MPVAVPISLEFAEDLEASKPRFENGVILELESANAAGVCALPKDVPRRSLILGVVGQDAFELASFQPTRDAMAFKP
jgi:hypothetical protein